MAQAAESCRGVVTLDAEGDEKLDSFCWNTLKFLYHIPTYQLMSCTDDR